MKEGCFVSRGLWKPFQYFGGLKISLVIAWSEDNEHSRHILGVHDFGSLTVRKILKTLLHLGGLRA